MTLGARARSAALPALLVALSPTLPTLPLFAPGAAHAHGTLPTCNSLSFGPGDGRMLLGTNFGGVLIDMSQPTTNSFLCETLVSGTQQSVDQWLWLKSGIVVAIASQGGFFRGVFAAQPGLCGFGTAPGTDAYLMTELVQDPADPASFYGVGFDDAGGVLLHGSPDGMTVVQTVPGTESFGVRAEGDTVIASFGAGTSASIVAITGADTETFTQTVDSGAKLRPLAIDPSNTSIVWFAESADTAEALVRSPDRGRTLVTKLSPGARIAGVAVIGTHVYVQAGRDGISRSDDGDTFTPWDGSPHGAAIAADGGKLYACGVPWQDDVVVARSDTGSDFAIQFRRFDDIVGPISCAAPSDTTSVCQDELQFLRGYYGFGDPATFIESGPEVAEDVPDAGAETVEPVAEGADSDATAEVVDNATHHGGGGCSGAGPAFGWAGLCGLAAAWLRRRARS